MNSHVFNYSFACVWDKKEHSCWMSPLIEFDVAHQRILLPSPRTYRIVRIARPGELLPPMVSRSRSALNPLHEIFHHTPHTPRTPALCNCVFYPPFLYPLQYTHAS